MNDNEKDRSPSWTTTRQLPPSIASSGVTSSFTPWAKTPQYVGQGLSAWGTLKAWWWRDGCGGWKALPQRDRRLRAIQPELDL